VKVLGISADSPASHAKFAKKYDLNFPLLSDPTFETIKKYGAFGPKKMFGKEFDGILRQTFLIDPKGEIAKQYPKVTPESHAAEILTDLEALRSV
jgi:peroxiredoxin Q/BCP